MAAESQIVKALRPSGTRAESFERMSAKTMRYVHSVPSEQARGLVARVYEMLAGETFINGAVTSHTKVPELMAGMWIGGREIILVSGKLDRTSKVAMSATLSQVNGCPYCTDMLVGLMHSDGKHDIATGIFADDVEQIQDPEIRARCTWVRTIAAGGQETPNKPPFTAEELPEAIGSLFVFSYINRFSHVVMDGSPFAAPFGLQKVKEASLRIFGSDLRTTQTPSLEAGLSLDLLPSASLPEDLAWAKPDHRVSDALARWAAAIERETPYAVSQETRESVERNLQAWNGGLMPNSRCWVDSEVQGLAGEDQPVARLALVVAKASHQVSDDLVAEVLGPKQDEEKLIRILAWASHTAARRVADRYYKFFLT